MGAREDDLRSARTVLHFQDHRPDAVMNFEAFARDSLVGRQDTFGFHVETDGRCLGICRLDNAADDLAHLALEILHLIRTLGFPDALLDHLARGLRGNAAEIGRGGLDDDHIAKLRFQG